MTAKRKYIANKANVELEILQTGLEGDALVSIRIRDDRPRRDESADMESMGVGFFPAPEPWLRDVLPH
jgi:hypothetical protein